MAMRQQSTIQIEKNPEVAARVKSNSLSMDLKKTPKVERVPQIVVPAIKKTATTSQP